MKSVIVIGAGGHAKVVTDIIEKNNDKVIGFLDSCKKRGETFLGYPVLGNNDDFAKFKEHYFIIAIGNSDARETIYTKMKGVKWYTAIHPQAVISPIDTAIDVGTTIMANAVINPGSKIGKHCIINTSAIVEHDNFIDDYAHISVGAKLAGHVSIGKHTWVGIGAVIKNDTSICEKCMIGAGAVVVKNITSSTIYIGVPAKPQN